MLFPIFAFNIEVARAPWMTREQTIAAMRLQWWRDALVEIGAGGMVRRHEVVVPLAQVVDGPGAELLDRVIVARHKDLEPQPFKDDAALWSYLEETTGCLMEAAARGLGAEATEAAQQMGRAVGLANYLRAVPALVAAGRHPLPDGRESAVRALAEEAEDDWRAAAHDVPKALRLTGWLTPMILRRARRDPLAVGEDRLTPGPLRSSLALGRMALIG